MLVTLRNQRDHYEHWPALQLPLLIMRRLFCADGRRTSMLPSCMIFMDLFQDNRGGLSAHPAGAAAALNRGGSIRVVAIAVVAWLETTIAKFAGSMVSAGGLNRPRVRMPVLLKAIQHTASESRLAGQT